MDYYNRNIVSSLDKYFGGRGDLAQTPMREVPGWGPDPSELLPASFGRKILGKNQVKYAPKMAVAAAMQRAFQRGEGGARPAPANGAPCSKGARTARDVPAGDRQPGSRRPLDRGAHGAPRRNGPQNRDVFPGRMQLFLFACTQEKNGGVRGPQGCPAYLQKSLRIAPRRTENGLERVCFGWKMASKAACGLL